MIPDIIRICAAAGAFKNAKRLLLACEALYREEHTRGAALQVLSARDRVEEARTALRELLQALPAIDWHERPGCGRSSGIDHLR